MPKLIPKATGMMWICTAQQCNSAGILYGGRWKNACPLCGNTDIEFSLFTGPSPKPSTECKLIFSEKKPGRGSAFNPAPPAAKG